MRQQADHYQQRIFVAEGEKVVRRLLQSDFAVISALMTADHFAALRPALEGRCESIEVFLGEKELLETLTGFSMFQGLLVCARIPPPVELDVAFAKAAPPRFLTALDGLANAENLGGIVRTAAAFGAQAVIVGETCASPFLRRAVRASMGTIFRMPVVEPVALRQALQDLRRRGVCCIAAHPHSRERFLPKVILRGDCCIVLGNEADGICPAVR